MYLLPKDGQSWPKNVAFVDEANTICCGYGIRL